MAANCDVCGKGPGFGNNISHSHRRTPRRWNPNIQRVRTVVGGHAEARERLHLVHQGRQGLALTIC
ncbi:50S ribosomal protein L28 [Streptomyces sp. GTA36]